MRIYLLTLVLFFSSISLIGQDLKRYMTSISKIIMIDSSDYILLPIEWETNAKIDGIKILGGYTYRNILVYNPNTDETNLIFKDGIQMVTPFQYTRIYYERQLKPIKLINDKFLLISARNVDFDKNKKLNFDDPLILFMYNIETNELIQLTPSEYSIKDYKHLSHQNIILVSLRKDSNNDLTFDNKDKEILYKVNLSDLSKSKELFELIIRIE